jgi:hypothetical protein
LTHEEQTVIDGLSEQVKKLAGNVGVEEAEAE